MPITHLATVICDYLVVHPDGRYTAVNSYNNIMIAEIPASKVPFCFVIELIGTGQYYRVVLEGPAGRIDVGEGRAIVPKDRKADQQYSTTFTATLSPMIFPKAGVYSIVVYEGKTGKKEVHRRHFGVVFRSKLEEDQTK